MGGAWPEKWTAKLMQERIRRHWVPPQPLPGGVYLPEVTMGAAGGKRADGVYVGFQRSRGEFMVGHEIKVTRADWLHELDDPSKADVWASECHAWYIVAPPGIVRPEELPHGWGLMQPNPKTTTRLDIIVKAKVHEDRQPSWTAVHSVIKRMDTLRANAIQAGVTKARADISAEYETLLAHAREFGGRIDLSPRIAKLEASLAELAGIIGVEGIDADHAYSWGDRISVEQFGRSFGRYLIADRDIDQALNSRINQLVNDRRMLDRLAQEVGQVEQATRALLVTEVEAPAK